MSRQNSTLLKPILLLFAISLLVRGVTAMPERQPHNLDEAYHTVNAITLATGGGFTEHFIWNYLSPPATVTHPANRYWLPLTAMLAAAGMALGGANYAAGQRVFVLLAALLPPLTFWLAMRVTGNRRQAWLAALLMLFSGFYFAEWTAIDTFAPFALAGALCLIALWRAADTADWRWTLGAGIAAGLAHLLRADGVLFLVLGFGFLGSRFKVQSLRFKVQSPKSKVSSSKFKIQGFKSRFTQYAIRFTFSRFKSKVQGLRFKVAKFQNHYSLFVIHYSLLVSGYLLVMASWFIRNWRAFGALMPPGGTKTLWLTRYDDIFSVTADLSWRGYLAWGWGNILQSKMWAVWMNLQTLTAVIGLVVVFPLAVIGWWQLRRHPLFQLAAGYLGLLWLAMTFAFTFPGVRGALFHSGGAVLPPVAIAGVVGLDAAIAWVAQRRRGWHIPTAQKVFGGGLVFFAALISLFTAAQKLSAWNTAQAEYAAIIPALPNPAATVMAINPPAVLYFGGEKAIAVPNEPPETVITIARKYGADYLILEKNHPAPLDKLYRGDDVPPQFKLLGEFENGTKAYQIASDE